MLQCCRNLVVARASHRHAEEILFALEPPEDGALGNTSSLGYLGGGSLDTPLEKNVPSGFDDRVVLDDGGT